MRFSKTLGALALLPTNTLSFTQAATVVLGIGNAMKINEFSKTKSLAITWGAVAMAAFFFSTAHAQEGAEKYHVKSDLFLKQNLIKCGKINIALVTSCLEKNGDSPYCFNQTISFIKIDGDIEKTIIFSSKYKDGNQEFITKISCLKDKKENLLVVESTNFGSCKICEWMDLFLTNGNYLGSTQGIYDSSNFSRKLLPKKVIDFVSNSIRNKSLVIEEAEIFRTN